MNREDIIRMAREAGWDAHHAEFDTRIERFAALVASAERERTMEIVQSMKAELEAKFEKTYMEGVVAGASAEREACAKLCENKNTLLEWPTYAAAIRARGQAT